MRAIVIAVLVVAALAARASAFPQLAIRGEVSRCSNCHVSPAGGGLLNDYGREEAGDTLSRGGDGRFLAGAIEPPSWLVLGGDLRAAALAYDDRKATEGVQLAAFPMEADLRAAIVAGPITVVATGGLKGSTRLYNRSASDYVISNEHYVMWRSSPVGVYARAGRFFPIQGLRLPDHTLYVRRYTGTNLWEEPYAVSIGDVQDGWELHAAAFTHDPLLDVGRRESGAVVDGEAHGETWQVGVSMRAGTGGDGTRALVGAYGRTRAPAGLVLLGEVDVIRDQVQGGPGVDQAVGMVGADERLTQGVQLFGWYEQYQEELGLRGAIHHGVGLSLLLYPRAHWEVIVEGRAQKIGARDTVGMTMLQLHYYL